MFISAQYSFSQDNYFSLCFGSNKTLGNFSKSNNILNGGYASSGFIASYSGAFYFQKRMGIAGNFSFNSNLIDAENAQNDLVEIYEEAVINEMSLQTNIGQWSTVTLNAGPQFTLPAGNFAFDFFVLAGVDIIFAPEYEISIRDQNNTELFHTKLESANARPGLDAGMSIRYLLNDVLGIRIFVSYLQSGTNGKLLLDYNSRTIRDSLKFKNKIQILYAGIGLVYRL